MGNFPFVLGLSKKKRVRAIAEVLKHREKQIRIKTRSMKPSLYADMALGSDQNCHATSTSFTPLSDLPESMNPHTDQIFVYCKKGHFLTTNIKEHLFMKRTRLLRKQKPLPAGTDSEFCFKKMLFEKSLDPIFV